MELKQRDVGNVEITTQLDANRARLPSADTDTVKSTGPDRVFVDHTLLRTTATPAAPIE